MKKNKRIEYDFSNHELIVVETENYNSYRLKHPEYSQMFSVTFINTNGVCAVTGDFGNYIFCREFHPSAKGYVSDHYWLEKLQNSSDQSGEKFDSDKTRELINELITDLENDEESIESDKHNDELEYLNELLDYVDRSEFEYSSYAYNNYPSWYDCESVPFCKSIKPQLLIVFDAFEEICLRIKNKEENGK